MSIGQRIVARLKRFVESLDEKAAAKELKRITPTNAELLKLADRFPAPQEWYDEDYANRYPHGIANTTNDFFYLPPHNRTKRQLRFDEELT